MHDILPEELVSKIFDELPTKERIRLAVVCKTWQKISLDNLSSVSLKFASLEELQKQHAWLDMLAHHSPLTLSSIQMHWLGGKLLHPATGNLQLNKFVNLKSLDLKRPESNCWLVTPNTVLGWNALTNLEELTVSFSPFYIEGRGSLRTSDQPITLIQFTFFKKLRKLSVTMHPYRGWESGWDLQLTSEFEDLRHLEDFAIAGLKRVTPNSAFHKIVSQLKSLDLDVREPLQDVIKAPCLESLNYSSLDSNALPFQFSEKLKRLSYNGPFIPSNLPTQSPGLSNLSFGEKVVGVNQTELQYIGEFKGLKDLKVTGFITENEDLILDPFSNMKRLETLELVLAGPEHFCSQLGVSCHLFTNLKVLKISNLMRNHLTLQNNFQSFPVLEVLHLEVCSVLPPISSSSLKELSLTFTSCTKKAMKHSEILGDLPQLRCFKVKGDMHTKEICRLMDQLRNSEQLAKLYVQKRDNNHNEQVPFGELIFAYPPEHWKNGPPGRCEALYDDTLQEDRDFVEQVLDHARKISSLQVLQIAAVNNDVRLTRSIVPSVQHLGIACKHLSLCDSCNPWSQFSLQLLFVKANDHTHQLLGNHNFSFSQPISETLEHFNAVKFFRGELPYEFSRGMGDIWVDAFEPDLIEHSIHHQMFPFGAVD